MKKPLIWLAEDDDSLRWVIEQQILSNKQSVQSFSQAEALLEALSTERRLPDVIITDIHMSSENGTNIDGLTLTSEVSALPKYIPIIVITAYNDLNTTVNAYKKGAYEFLAKPFDLDALNDVINKALKSIPDNENISAPLEANNTIIGDSPAIQQIFQVIGKLSKSHMNVLIYGESGTGKELVSRALHDNSPRNNGPFIALNTAAIPQELLEAELFGYEKGAFVGAVGESIGHFEKANNGTLFLDEVGDMPLNLQTRLLRVIQDGQFYRVGGRKLVKSNTRIIAATNQDLTMLVKQGLFREDLYHRLNVMYIELPPLRERSQDIVKLCQHFLNNATTELNTANKTFSNNAIAKLMQFAWPGNVRQLENICKRLSAMVAANTISVADLPVEFIKAGDNTEENNIDVLWKNKLRDEVLMHLELDQPEILNYFVSQAEEVVIDEVLKFYKSNKLQSSKKLGCGRTTLDRKLAEFKSIKQK